MNNIYINNQHLKNFSNFSTNSNFQATSNPITQPISNNNSDTFVKKESDTKNIKKTSILIATAAMLIASGIAIFKQRDTSKIKKLLRNEYNKMTDDIAKEMKKSGFEFTKPKLKFKNLDKNTMGAYNLSDNEVILNKIYLDPQKISTKIDLDDISVSEYADNSISNRTTTFVNPNKWKKKGYRPLTSSEKLTISRKDLAHELEHARQHQISLQAEGAKDLCFKYYKGEHPEGTDDEIKQAFKFTFSFSPKKDFTLDTPIIQKDELISFPKNKEVNPKFFHFVKTNGDNNIYNPIFTPRMMLNSHFNYTKEDLNKYYANLGEIFARQAEYKFCKKHLKGCDDEFSKRLIENTKYNYQSLLKYMAFSK